MTYLRFLSLSLAVASVAAQSSSSSSSNTNAVDPALLVTIAPGINFAGCESDLVQADLNGDGKVNDREYLRFVNLYGRRKCWSTDTLTLPFQSAFNQLSCICQQRGGAADCCLGSNANIPTAGASSTSSQTEDQRSYLSTVCVTTDGLINSKCDAQVLDRGTPPPIQVVPVTPPVPDTSGGDGGLSNGSKAAIIAAVIAALLLLLLLCCCCCLLKRRAAKELEEEEAVAKQIENNNIPDVEAPAEQSPRDIKLPAEEQPLPVPIVPAVPAGVAPSPAASRATAPPAAKDDDDDDDDDGMERNRGGGHETEDILADAAEIRQPGYIEEEEEEDPGAGRKRAGGYTIDGGDNDGRRLRGQGELPPENNPNNKHNLRPPPPQEKEPDQEWDYPGREMVHNRNVNEDEGQVFDPYNPDGGVHDPKRPGKDPLDWKKDWNREKVPDPDDSDNRKHRIQSGLGEGEVWDKLGEKDEADERDRKAPESDVFDWVVQSALGVLDRKESEAVRPETDY